MVTQEQEYANAEIKHFPKDWDDLTKSHVVFMIKEAFREGRNVGYKMGEGTGKGMAVLKLYDVIKELQKK